MFSVSGGFIDEIHIYNSQTSRNGNGVIVKDDDGGLQSIQSTRVIQCDPQTFRHYCYSPNQSLWPKWLFKQKKSVRFRISKQSAIFTTEVVTQIYIHIVGRHRNTLERDGVYLK